MQVEKLLLCDHSISTDEAEKRLKLEHSFYYFQMHKPVHHMFLHNQHGLSSVQTQRYPCGARFSANKLHISFCFSWYCRVLIDNLQTAMHAQFDSKVRSTGHSYEKYNTWDQVKSKCFPLYQLDILASIVKMASDILPSIFPSLP